MLRTFPKEMLKKIPADIIEEFYARKGVEEPEEPEEPEEVKEELCICSPCNSNKQEKDLGCEKTWLHTTD